MRTLLLSLLLVPLLVLPAGAQTLPSEFARILLPIFLPRPVAGAFGSSWRTDTLLFVDSPVGVRILPGCDSSGAGFCDLGPRATFSLESGQTRVTESASRFLYVAKASASALAISLCLFQGEGASACVPLPVAREEDFRSRIVLPFVPLQPGTRVALRLFGSSPVAGSVRLRLYRLDRLDPFVDEMIPLARTDLQEPFESEPPFAFVADLVARWPQLQAASSVRVEIDSLQPAQRIWAIASVTQNQTQDVRIFSPH